MTFRRFSSVLLITFLFLLMSCSGEDIVVNNPRSPAPVPDYTFVHFDPTAGDPSQIPLPNDILRNPATGQVALPNTGDPAIDALIAQVNTLPGFGTTSPFRIPFAGQIDANSVNNQTLIVVDLVTQMPAPMSYVVKDDESGDNSVVLGFPVTPLQPGRPHIVIVTQGVIGLPSNLPVESEPLSLLLKGGQPLTGATAALEPVRQLYNGVVWPAAEAIVGVGRTFIPFAFIYSTQPLYSTLTELRTRAQSETPAPQSIIGAVGAPSVDGLFNLLGIGFVPHDSIGAVYQGTFNAPNYISNPVNGPFQGSGAAVVEVGRNDLSFLVSLPPGTGPFPTIIFQHGITGFKEQMFALANSANSIGFAVIGINLVLHGDRTADVLNNDTGAPGPDGQPDPSGSNFINLANLLMSRDNARQSAGDLFMLTRMITSGAADFSGDGVPELAPVGPGFIGMSLGGIVGTSFVTMEPDVRFATLNVAGGRVAYLLNNSPAFGPSIDAGLAQFGLVPGTALYDIFFMFTQAIVDDSDPLNYGQHSLSGSLSGSPTSILLQEVIGDTVVPNSATTDLARAMGLPQVDAQEVISGLSQVSSPVEGSGLFQFPTGNHSVLLDPSNGNPTAEVQLQALTFIGSAFQGMPTIINPLLATKLFYDELAVGIRGLETNIDPKFVLRFPQK